MTQVTRLDKFKLPLTGQEIELQQLDYEGGMSQIRIRIRERSRFTIVDVDPVTARHWGDALSHWAQCHTSPARPPGIDSERTGAAPAARADGAERDG